MTSIEIIDDIQHKELQIDFTVARLAYRKNIIPVVVSEFHSLMFHYPIVFVKDMDTGQFTCSVLLGINEAASLLDIQNIENDDAMPLNIRRLPLVAIAPAEGETRPLVGINMASPSVGQGDFVCKHKSDRFESAIYALGELYEGYKETDIYIKKILELDLLSKLHAEIRNPDKPVQILDGLYAIDLNKVAQIAERDEASKDIFLGIASYVYAQNFSLFNMKKMASLIS
jgi:hypothetical protein